MQVGSALKISIADFRPMPINDDNSFIIAAIESLYYISRATGMSRVEADHMIYLVKSNMMQLVKNDLSVVGYVR